MPVVTPVSCQVMPKFRIGVLRLGYAGQRSRGNEGGIVETILGGQPELVPHGQRRQLFVSTYGPVVRKNPKNALRLFLVAVATLDRRFSGPRRGPCRGFQLGQRGVRQGLSLLWEFSRSRWLLRQRFRRAGSK